MKLRKSETEEYIELPSNGTYPIYSGIRIDARPGEIIEIPTGLELLANKSDNVKLEGEFVVTKDEFYGRSYQEIVVQLYNPSERTKEVHPGEQVATLTYVPQELEGSTVSFTTKAEFNEDAHAD